MENWRSDVFGIVLPEESFLYAGPGSGPDSPSGVQTDILLSGWAVRLTGEEKNGWVSVQSFYGYPGWLRRGDLRLTGCSELQLRADPDRFLWVTVPFLDLRTEPGVTNPLRTVLPRFAVVEALSELNDSGWRLVRSSSGAEGWVPGRALKPRSVGDGFLLQPAEDYSWFPGAAAAALSSSGEDALRAGVVASALSWRGVSYRWGGKSPRGIDCSGMAFMSWLENGVLIYRDAQIRPGFPVHPVSREKMKPGDLIFFPGHVAVYLGEDRYAHATAYAQTPWVTVNSLNPADPLFRRDLAESITAVGSVFACTH